MGRPSPNQLKRIICAMTVVGAMAASAPATVYDAEAILNEQFASTGGLGKASIASRTAALERLASRLKAGDALILPSSAFGKADLTALPNDIEISGGIEGEIYLGGRHEDMVILNTRVPIQVGHAASGLGKQSKGSSGLYNTVSCNTAGISGANLDNGAHLFVESFGKIELENLSNSVIIYMAYNVPNCGTGQAAGDGDHKLMMSGNCANTRIYHMVETNYCMAVPSVIIDGVTGPLTFLVGDTERANSADYRFVNSSDITFGLHRMFHPHGGHISITKALSIDVSGGSDIRFYQSQCIGAPKALSLNVQNATNFQIWGGSWEDAVRLPDQCLQVFNTPNCFGRNVPQDQWHEPAEVQDEVIFNYNQVDFTVPDNAGTVALPKPPAIPPAGFPEKASYKLRNPRYLAKANFGAAALAAGADPTGRRPSDDAFAKVLASRGTLEIPAGEYLLTRPLIVSAGGGLAKAGARTGQMIQGQGMHKTVLRAAHPDMPVIKFVDDGLAKLGETGPVKPGESGGVTDMTIEGGNWGIDLTCVYYASKKFMNLIIKDQTVTGVMTGDGNIGVKSTSEKGGCFPHEFDQNRFVNVQFLNTGDWGIYNNMPMTDKLLFFECVFEGQKKAGIAFHATHMFAGSIIQCEFRNIDGPGVDFYHFIDSDHGFTPHCTMIESCRFIECGNATRPAIDFNWMESGGVFNTDIIIKEKPWSFGFLGAAQAMYNVNVDVDATKMVEGGAAIGLRSTRQAKNARPTGNILHKVTSQGRVAFVNDVPDNVSLVEAYGDHYAGYEWAYPSLFIECEFGNGSLPYALAACDLEANLTKFVALEGQNSLDDATGYVSARNAAPQLQKKSGARQFEIFTVAGQRIAVVKSKHLSPVAVVRGLNLARGTYLVRGRGLENLRVRVVR